MADILEFRPIGVRSSGEASSGPAQIVIFPGIRYERLEADDEDVAPDRKRKSRSLPKRRQG